MKETLHCRNELQKSYMRNSSDGFQSLGGYYIFSKHMEVLIGLRNLKLQSCLVSDGGQGLGHLNFWEVVIATNH